MFLEVLPYQILVRSTFFKIFTIMLLKYIFRRCDCFQNTCFNIGLKKKKVILKIVFTIQLPNTRFKSETHHFQVLRTEICF